MTTPPLPEQIEHHRDRMWRREEEFSVESAFGAERFVEEVGFANALTDTGRAGPSLYIAVCGRRELSLPHTNHGRRQKDEETRLTWHLKDEVMCTLNLGSGLRFCDSHLAKSIDHAEFLSY